MVLSGCWIVLGAALMNIYARQLPYRSSSLIFDMTNQQFLGVCNVVLVGVLLSIVASNEPLDLSLVFLKLIASYGAILGFRLYYTDSLRL
jgi:urea transporter